MTKAKTLAGSHPADTGENKETQEVLLLHELAQNLAVASLAVGTLARLLEQRDVERALQQCAAAETALDTASRALRAAKFSQLRSASVDSRSRFNTTTGG